MRKLTYFKPVCYFLEAALEMILLLMVTLLSKNALYFAIIIILIAKILLLFMKSGKLQIGKSNKNNDIGNKYYEVANFLSRWLIILATFLTCSCNKWIILTIVVIEVARISVHLKTTRIFGKNKDLISPITTIFEIIILII